MLMYAYIFHMLSDFTSYLYAVAFRLQHLNYSSAAGRYHQHGFIQIVVVFLNLKASAGELHDCNCSYIRYMYEI